jgi:hypothetical protein
MREDTGVHESGDDRIVGEIAGLLVQAAVLRHVRA